MNTLRTQLLAFMLFVSFLSKSQTVNKHLIWGIDGGYSFFPKEVGYKGDFDFKYMFAYKHFAINLSAGLAPKTNFGRITKFSALMGYTTDINKQLSWHLLVGGVANFPYYGMNYFSDGYYLFSTSWLGANTGVYYRIKQSNFLLGLNAVISSYHLVHRQENSQGNYYTSSQKKSPYLNLNLSLNYDIDGSGKGSIKKLPDTLNKNIHLVGLDLGYTPYPKYVGYKGETNLSYLYARKHFAANLNVGIAPFTNYGVVSKYSAGIGFTTRLERNFSWHLLFGFAIGGTSKESYEGYSFGIYGYMLNTGFYQRIKQSNFLIGFNLSLASYNAYNINQKYHYNSYGGLAAYTNLSLNYKLNFDKIKLNKKDTLSKPKNITHFVGAGLAYSFYPKYVGYKGETYLSYFFAYKHFALNLAASVAPATNFGVIERFPLQIGVTSKAYKQLSWHLLAGVSLSRATKERYVISADSYKIFSPDFYFTASTGIYYRIKQSNFSLGIDAALANCDIGEPRTWDNKTRVVYDNIPYLQINASLNYKLNFKKHEN